jgi:NifU-like protein involved in Fe-S cluster formation
MAYSEKVIDHYENPATSVVLTRTIPASAPAWSVHRPVVT